MAMIPMRIEKNDSPPRRQERQEKPIWLVRMFVLWSANHLGHRSASEHQSEHGPWIGVTVGPRMISIHERWIVCISLASWRLLGISKTDTRDKLISGGEIFSLPLKELV